MAFMYISEYRGMPTVGGKFVQAADELQIAEQKIAIAAGSTSSAAFNAKTRFVRIHVDAICSFLFGPPTPTATVANKRIAANATEYFGVPEGSGWMVANITNT
jgi:hypothetical protein